MTNRQVFAWAGFLLKFQPACARQQADLFELPLRRDCRVNSVNPPPVQFRVLRIGKRSQNFRRGRTTGRAAYFIQSPRYVQEYDPAVAMIKFPCRFAPRHRRHFRPQTTHLAHQPAQSARQARLATTLPPHFQWPKA